MVLSSWAGAGLALGAEDFLRAAGLAGFSADFSSVATAAGASGAAAASSPASAGAQPVTFW